MEQFKMSLEISKMMKDFNKVKTAKVLTIKKFNKLNQLCYYDRIDLTFKEIDDNCLKIIVELFENAGYKTTIKETTYQGIYDPSRVGELIEIHPTDLELLEKESRFAKYTTNQGSLKVKKSLISKLFN